MKFWDKLFWFDSKNRLRTGKKIPRKMDSGKLSSAKCKLIDIGLYGSSDGPDIEREK